MNMADSPPRAEPPTPVPERHRHHAGWTTAVTLGASALIVASLLLPLALTRYIHVDESQVAYNAALLGLHGLPEYMNFHAPLVVPLSWIAARGGGATWPTLVEMRLVFVALLLVNLALVAACAPRIRGGAARSLTFLGVLLVEPIWRHGFEIRHDANLLATSLGLALLAVRATRAGAGRLTFLAAGVLTGWMQLNSFKAFLLWPVGLAILWAASRVRPGQRLRPGTALTYFVVGAGAAFATGWALLATAGIERDMVRNLAELALLATEYSRFSAGGRLLGLGWELIHLTVSALLAMGLLIRAAQRRRWREEAPSLVVAAWFVLQLLALSINPTPFSYNFVHVLPFFYLLAVDGFSRLVELASGRSRALLIGLGLAAATATFARSWNHDRVGRISADPQRRHIEAVEALTAPDDPVLDAAGLVLSRRPPGRNWMLHSLMMPAYRRGDTESFVDTLTRDPAPVLMTNYRWEWLGPKERNLVTSRYIALGPRLLVLGGAIRSAGFMEIHRRGRYVLRGESSDAALLVDNVALPEPPVLELVAGTHSVSSAATWAWIGPELSAFPASPPLLINRDLFVSD